MEDTTASLVTLADGAGRALSLLQQGMGDGKGVPSDVYELRDELNRLAALLGSLRHTVRTGQPVFLTANVCELETLARDVATVQRGLDTVRLIVASIPEGPTSTRVWRDFWVRRRHELAQIRVKIREASHDMLSTLMALNMTVSADMYALVRQQERNSQSHQRDLLAHMDRRFNTLSPPAANRTLAAAAPLPFLASLAARDSQRQPDATGRFQHQHHLEAVLATTAEPTVPPRSLPQRWGGQRTAARRCRCTCHAKTSTRLEISTFTKALFGSLLLGYVRSQGAGRACKIQCCSTQEQLSRDIRITYHFPTWLLRTAVTAVFTDVPSPELLLRVHRRIPTRFDIFDSSLIGYAVFNKIGEAQRCLQQRLGSVSDIMDESGFGPLDLALRERHTDMAMLCIREGADIFQDTSCIGPSCIKFIQDIYQNGLAKPSSGDGWRSFEQLLPMDRILAYMDLSPLHEAVLGIRHTDIRYLLEQDICPVDTLDIAGQTALYYATVRGDTDSVAALLAAGAHPDPHHFGKASPLSEACRQGLVDIARLLIAAGANVNVHDVTGRGWGGATPMHRLGHSGRGSDAVQIATEMLQHGADLHAEDGVGGTPLHQTCYHDTVELVDWYIRVGADVNRRDREGTTPLECAVAFSACRVAARLLAHGVDYTNIDEYGHNVLHHLAHYSNLAMMELFASVGRLRGLDIARTNVHGRTPLQMLNGRSFMTEELREAFGRVLDLASAEGMTAPCDGALVDGEDEEVFFDAPATLSTDQEELAAAREEAVIWKAVQVDESTVEDVDADSGCRAASPSSCLSHPELQGEEAYEEDPYEEDTYEEDTYADTYADTNKYRFPQLANGNAIKFAPTMRLEHLERREAEEPLASPPYLEAEHARYPIRTAPAGGEA